VELDRADGGFGLKVGRDAAEAEGIFVLGEGRHLIEGERSREMELPGV
jgi:hypothetical protein